MVATLLSHQWKEFWRSRNAGKNVAIQIFMGFLLIYVFLSALALGVMMPRILTELFPGQNIINIFCGLILYYFAFDIIMRFMLQELPTLSVQPYLVQNISRKQLVNFLNFRSLVSLFNLLPFILFIPFIASEIRSEYGPLVSFSFALSIISLCIFNHFLILFIKRKTIISSWWLAGFAVVVILLIASDYFGIFSIRKISSVLFTGLLNTPWLCIVAVALAIASFYNNRSFLLRNLYVEEMVKSSGRKTSVDYVWLNKFGNVGDLIALDIKLILRNKRPRSLTFLSVIFLFYGFIFYKTKMLDKGVYGTTVMGAMFITGMFMMTYGQYLFAWQCIHFDGLMASNIDLKTYIKSKLLLLTTFSTVALLLTLFYGLLSWKIIPIEIAAYFFNIGINTVMLVFFATRNYKAIDMSRTGSFNYQGQGATQYLYTLFVVIIGLIIYLPFSLLIDPWAGIIALGTLGLISFLLRDWWVGVLTRQLAIQKYRILEGFREK